MKDLLFALISLLPLAFWIARVAWSPDQSEGEVLVQIPVRLLARVKMLSVPMFVGSAIVVWGLLTQRISIWFGITAILAYAGILLVPIQYTLTSTGIRLGKGAFRRWTEFAGVRRAVGGALLQGGPQTSGYRVYLGGDRDDDQLVLTLKTLVRGSYKGQQPDVL